jgi:radical SAM superfamily enzyme YgiQ (UPF0313 family)
MFIVGIEPKAPGMHIFSQTHMPRLGLPQLLTIARQMGHECRIYCEEIAPIVWDDVQRADMILMSSTTSTAPRAYALTKKIKEDINSDAPLLMGGPHVTFLPEEALEKGADFVFRHEADESFVDFIKWWTCGRESHRLMDIPGLSFKMGNCYHHTAEPKPVNLDLLPTPDLDLIAGLGKPGAIPLITSRGCPWNCDFCSEVSMFGRAYRFRSEEKLIEDIRYYDKKYGKIPIFFADDNLAANLSRLAKLCEGIIKNHLIRAYSGQVRLDLAKHPNMLSLLNRTGFERVFIGYESTNEETLQAAHKGLSFDDMASYTKAIHKHGIEIHAMWVIGFDTDTLETVKNNMRASIKWKLETSQFLILVPIPGSKLYDNFKRDKRIFNHDWSKYDGHHVTFFPVKMTPKQLQVSVMLDAMPKLYNHWQTLKIFTVQNLQIVKGLFKIKTWHPIRSAKSSIITLFVRIWGRYTTKKMKKPIRNYLSQIPISTSERRHKTAAIN